MRYVCTICGYVYDEEKEGVSFADLPDTWACPLCGAGKESFKPEAHQNNEAKPIPVAHAEVPGSSIDPDMRRLGPGELAALCSNLARGCEKQYKTEEAALFAQIAECFSAHTPPESIATIDHLAKLVQGDLSDGYPELNAKARAAADRGTQRICTWGQKVTAIQSSLLSRWQKEGPAMLENTHVWVCTVCGFIYVGDEPPALCPVCKVPPWKFERVEGRRAS